MKYLKYTLIGIIAAIGAVLIVGLFAPKAFVVTRSTTIQAPKDSVFAYIKFLKNQDNFSVWAAMDPTMKKSYRGTDGSVGFVSAWESTNEDVGTGEQEIVYIQPGDSIAYSLRFIKPFEATNQAYLKTTATENNATQITWGISGATPYPFNVMMLFMDMDKQIGNDFEKGLNNLKGILEQR